MLPRTLAPAALLLALLLLSAGCQSGPRPAAEFVQQAQYLHDAALSSAVVKDADVAEYLRLVGRRVIAGATAANAANTRDPTLAGMQFHLVASDVVNAFGTGGGHVYVYNGLLQRCDSEEELAAAIAVQYAHALDLDHQRTGMRPDVRGGADRTSVDRVAFLFVTFPFTARQSLEADRRAFEIYARGGWDPRRFADLYAGLRAKGLDAPAGVGGDGQPRATLVAREQGIRALVGGLPAQSREWRKDVEADPSGFKELKQQAQRAAAATAPPTATARGLLYLSAFPNVVLPADQSPQQAAQGQLRKDLAPPTPNAPPIEPS
ncbi:MAG TPA: M48 family metalloprotease [Humisphaera sp.]